MRKPIIIFYIFLASTLLFSCGSPSVHYEDIPNSNWKQEDILVFELTKKDLTERTPLIYIRHNNDYMFQNIWLKITTEPKDSTQNFKRYQYQLAEKNGRWFGNKSGAIYTFSAPIEGLNCASDTCKILIEQDMRANPLIGIQSVGLGFE